MVFTRQCSQPAWPRGSFPRKSLAKPVEHAARFNPYYPDGMGVSVPPVADHLPEQPECPTWDNPKESFRATIARSVPQIVGLRRWFEAPGEGVDEGDQSFAAHSCRGCEVCFG
jgi:hypothetical protein